MTVLGVEVHRKLSRTWEGLEVGKIEQILTDAGVGGRAYAGVPAQLNVTRVSFSGTKSLAPTDAGVAPQTEERAGLPRFEESFDFDWRPVAGINGVGSAKNLRGKSSVLKVISWALVGRSPLRADVQHWIGAVNVEFTIDRTGFAVLFSVVDGVPNGHLWQRPATGGGDGDGVKLGSFTDAASFEALMNSFMLERLRLEDLSVWVKDQLQTHAWPAYAGALNFYADQLDPLIGNVSSLSTRLLQMFAGTSWASTVGQVNAAIGRHEYESKQAAEEAEAGTEFAKTQRSIAESRAERAQTALGALPAAAVDIAGVFALVGLANDTSRATHDLQMQLMTAQSVAADARARVGAETARRHAATEDALARKFFNSMEPTQCPRCASRVTAEHRQAEHDNHECSLCHAGLDLAALDDRVMVAAGVSEDERDILRWTATQAASLEDEPDDDADVVEVITALEQEAAAAEEVVVALETDVATAAAAEQDAAESAAVAEDAFSKLQLRQQAEIDLARALGALESLTATPTQTPGYDEDGLVKAVLRAAKSVVDKWLRTDQDPILAMISEEIAKLASEFGIANLEWVALKGNANMTVKTGGAEEGYGSISGGERIRLKIATAIALMRVGKREGVGRHPGLLFIDSPASEEIGEADLSQMLGALVDVATEADVQLFVATAHTSVLSRILPPANVRAAKGDGYVW
jgi:flagellar biosynthesis/type III secretory pathway protein FliH